MTIDWTPKLRAIVALTALFAMAAIFVQETCTEAVLSPLLAAMKSFDNTGELLSWIRKMQFLMPIVCMLFATFPFYFGVQRLRILLVFLLTAALVGAALPLVMNWIMFLIWLGVIALFTVLSPVTCGAIVLVMLTCGIIGFACFGKTKKSA
jgi:hypothetical protein